ncbi:MAG: hypothetical protein F4246_11045 [Rhodothermaceae bacterium]|nr:hypothetical protein [Rhodothermaceae bacterium]MYD57535.1 hypothetical protein [Rhodothermaceae bacterium]MYI43766.1 hypothetical protein [Rhodothermaceae bacterium]MYJ54833.1 hypothetical protein [Rhodothermaceae bacterium]
MSSLSAYRPRHWLLLVAGLLFFIIVLVRVVNYSMLPGMVIESWPTTFLFVTIVCAGLALMASLIVYCVQWVVTLIPAIKARHRAAST